LSPAIAPSMAPPYFPITLDADEISFHEAQTPHAQSTDEPPTTPTRKSLRQIGTRIRGQVKKMLRRMKA
jgi:hypothetical protein